MWGEGSAPILATTFLAIQSPAMTSVKGLLMPAQVAFTVTK